MYVSILLTTLGPPFIFLGSFTHPGYACLLTHVWFLKQRRDRSWSGIWERKWRQGKLWIEYVAGEKSLFSIKKTKDQRGRNTILTVKQK